MVRTVLDETRLGCALERERLAHGSYPASLDLLAPTYLPTLPPDVMNGEPLHYRLEAGGGYTLYSVGWNLQDDGGQVNAEGSGKDNPIGSGASGGTLNRSKRREGNAGGCAETGSVWPIAAAAFTHFVEKALFF